MNTENTRTSELCPICGEGHLSAHVGKNEVSYRGQSRAIDYEFSTCDSCGSEIATAGQTKANKRIMNAYRKEVDDLLAGNEILYFRKDVLHLSQKLAALVFGGGKIAFSRYEKDDIVPSDAMNSLLWLCMKNPQNVALLAEKRGIDLPSEVIDAIGRLTGSITMKQIVLPAPTGVATANSRFASLFSPASDAALGRFSIKHTAALSCNDKVYLNAA